MKIYLDVIFLVNLFMDTLILWLTSILDRRKASKKRLLLGGIIGSLIYCISLTVVFGNIFLTFAMGMVAICASVGFVFRPKKVKTYLRLQLFAVLSSVIVGGTFIAIINFTNASNLVLLGIHGFSLKLMVVLSTLIYGAIHLAGGVLVSSISKRQEFCRVEICLKGKYAEMTVLMDTGNFLSEDKCGRKIIIAEFSSIRNILSPTTQLLYLKMLSSEEIKNSIIDCEEINRLQLLHFSSLGAGKGSLTAYKIDFAKIYTEIPVMLIEPVLVVYNGHLSSNGSFCGIINPQILDG